MSLKVIRNNLTFVWLLLGCLAAVSCTRPCRTIVEVSLGNLDSLQAGAQPAVKRLSQEIHRCREARKYSISWKFPPAQEEKGWRALTYVRKDKTFGVVGYEYDPGSGTLGQTYLIDDSAIDEVAKQGGTLKDFAKYSRETPNN